MRPSLAALVTSSVVVCAHAHADHSSLNAVVTGDLSASDNAFSAADNRQADMFYQLRPGLLAAYETPRMIHELTGQLAVLGYLANSDKPTLTANGAWRAFFIPGPRSQVNLGASGGTSRLGTMASAQSPETTGALAMPVGQIDARLADASEGASYVATRETRLGQGLFTRWTATNDNQMLRTTTESIESGGTLDLDHTFGDNTFGIIVGASYLRMERISQLPVGPQGSRLDRQINAPATLNWRHDIDRHWSVGANGGVLVVVPLFHDPYPGHKDDNNDPGWYPTASAYGAYTDVWGRATLNVHRSVAANRFLAQNTVNEGAGLQVAMPLPWLDPRPHAHEPTLAGLGSIGGERTQLMDFTTGSLNGQFLLFHLDAGVVWNQTPSRTWGLRYELAIQHGDKVAELATASFYRNTLAFTFSIRYPEDVAVRVPRTNSVRSDRGDLAPIGAEPVIPDPTAPAPSEDDAGGGGGGGGGGGQR